MEEKSSSLLFHRFPLKRPELLQKWVAAVRRKNWNPKTENFTDTDKANESPGDVIETPTPQEDPDRETTNLKRSAASTGTLRVKRSKLGAVSAFIQELKVLKECINQPSSESECDVFGKHVAMQLKTLSTEQRVLAQEAIQSAITHCRLQDLHKQCSSSCTEQFITEKQADGSANVEETWLKEEEEEYELGLNVEEIKSELQEEED